MKQAMKRAVVDKLCQEIEKQAEEEIKLNPEEIEKVKQIKKKYLEIEKEWYDSLIEGVKDLYEDIKTNSSYVFDDFIKSPNWKTVRPLMSVFNSSNEIRKQRISITDGSKAGENPPSAKTKSQTHLLDDLYEQFRPIVYDKDD